LWLLAVVMSFAFSCLLYLQVTYVREVVKMRSAQFNETAAQCLFEVSRILEMEETRRYIEEDISRDIAGLEVQRILVSGNVQGGLDLTLSYQAGVRRGGVGQEPLSIFLQQSSNNIVTTSREYYETYKRRYLYNKSLMHEVIVNMLNTSSHRPIGQRVDFGELTNYLKTEFLNNGLDLPFVVEVINNEGKKVYQSGAVEKQPVASDVLTCALFPNDLPSRQNYMKVFFPTKRDYIVSDVSFMVPSVIFSLLLLITFLITLYIVFRQKKLSEMKADFINNMTHELKTPVSTISLAAQMLKDTDVATSPNVFQHICGVINEETRRLGFLVEKVLQVSLFDRRRATLNLKEINVNRLIAGITKTFSLQVEKYEGRLDTDLQAENSVIYADEVHLTNLLFNLMDNAVKYRRPDVPLHLTVRTATDNNKLLISVEDNGIGIKKEYLRKVFDRFFRVPTGNMHDVKGFGLGLAYVRKMVEEHNGCIRAEAGAENIGTRFIITLPLIKM